MQNEAVKIARRLNELAADQKARAAMADGPRRELYMADAKTCEEAVTLLQKLDTEVFRLREGIGCHFYGRISGPELVRMTQTWNGDPASVTAAERAKP